MKMLLLLGFILLAAITDAISQAAGPRLKVVVEPAIVPVPFRDEAVEVSFEMVLSIQNDATRRAFTFYGSWMPIVVTANGTLLMIHPEQDMRRGVREADVFILNREETTTTRITVKAERING